MPMYAGDNKYIDAEWLKYKIIKAHPEMEEAIRNLDGPHIGGDTCSRAGLPHHRNLRGRHEC